MEFVAAGWLVYREVVETLSNYKKSYFWRYRNPTCGDSTESNQIEKGSCTSSTCLTKEGRKGRVI